MEAAFSWLANLTEWLGRFVPRWQVLDPTLGWVKFYANGKVKAGRGGWVGHWPVTQKVEIHSVAEQTIKLEPQSIITKDHEDVTVRGVIVYEFTDVKKLGEIVDPDDAVRDKALLVIFKALQGQYTKNELVDTVGTDVFDSLLRTRATRLLKRYGVRVIRLGLVEASAAKPYRVIQGGSGEVGGIPMPLVAL